MTMLQIGKLTDIGQRREHNEDSLYAFDSFIQTNDGLDCFGLFIVADGTGGHAGGEIASAIAVRTVASHMLENVYVPSFKEGIRPDLQLLAGQMTEAILLANTHVIGQVEKAGSTLTMAVIMGQDLYVAHVGDSRAYIHTKGYLKQLTQDHSLKAKMIETGQITPEEARRFHIPNIIYNAVGQEVDPEVALYSRKLLPENTLLLCSDGLWEMVTDEEMVAIIDAAATPNEAARKLIQTANEHGGNDNITAILVQLSV